MTRIVKRVQAVVRLACMMLILTMLGIVGGQVAVRFLFGASWLWAEEMIRYSLTWLGFLGISLAVISHTHAEVDYFVNRMPDATRKIVTLLVLVLCVVFFGYLLVYGYRLSIRQARFRSPILRVSGFYQYLAVPVSSAIVILDLGLKIIAKIRADWLPGVAND